MFCENGDIIWVDISFVNNGETRFFGHNIMHCQGSAIHNQFLCNFACRSIEKKSEIDPIFVYQLGYRVLYNSRNNNTGQKNSGIN